MLCVGFEFSFLGGYFKMNIKTIAVLTSGGDAPGMNAAVRSVVRAGISNGMRVIGVKRGYSGLLNKDIVDLNLRSVSDIIHRGGTALFTARSPEFHSKKGVYIAKHNCIEMGIDAVIVIGGDGSFRGAKELSDAGITCIGIPGTIDNDISCTDYTIGFDTAMNTAIEMVDKIRDTAQSHERCSVVEVMGRRCGDIALQSGIAVGATAILVPEIPFDFERDVIERIRFTQKIGKKHFIIIVAEGVGKVEEITKRINTCTGLEVRSTVLGHVQRGGSPTLRDRVIASAMGCRAIDTLLEDKGSRIIAVKESEIVDYDITEAMEMKRIFDLDLYKVALKLSI